MTPRPAPAAVDAPGSAGNGVREPRLVVVDVETTGFRPSDRVVEVAAVTLGPELETLDEWVTLVQPEADVGPTHVHGITADMVADAPRFAEVAGSLYERLDGAVLVAHNVAFDLRFLEAELARLGASLEGVPTVCTLQLARAAGIDPATLPDCCAALGVDQGPAHDALADARAAAEVLRRLREDDEHARQVVEAARGRVQLLPAHAVPVGRTPGVRRA